MRGKKKKKRKLNGKLLLIKGSSGRETMIYRPINNTMSIFRKHHHSPRLSNNLSNLSKSGNTRAKHKRVIQSCQPHFKLLKAGGEILSIIDDMQVDFKSLAGCIVIIGISSIRLEPIFKNLIATDKKTTTFLVVVGGKIRLPPSCFCHLQERSLLKYLVWIFIAARKSNKVDFCFTPTLW